MNGTGSTTKGFKEMQVQDNGTRITLLKPFDGHQHVRDGVMLDLVAPMVAGRFFGAIIMPNLKPPIVTTRMVHEYANKIGRACGHRRFYPFMTLYLTDTLDPKEVSKGDSVVGVKYYPKGVTTNSNEGIVDPASLWTPGTNAHNVLRALADTGKVLLLHAADSVDKNGQELDPYDQESHFFRESLPSICDAHPELKISVEHLSTEEGVKYMLEHGDPKRLGCSLTQHHLAKDRGDVYRGGLNVHLVCRPAIQSSRHKDALRALAVANKPFVWLGSDSAPHPVSKKRADCCATGIFTAHIGIEGYVEVFEDMGALDDRFEQFASINGPYFYNIPRSHTTVTLVRENWKVKGHFTCFSPIETGGSGAEDLIPFRLGETIRWKLLD